MKDCKHEHFQSDCAVCWVKLSMGIEVKDTPKYIFNIREYKIHCKHMAMMVSEEKLNDMLRKNMPDKVKD